MGSIHSTPNRETYISGHGHFPFDRTTLHAIFTPNCETYTSDWILLPLHSPWRRWLQLTPKRWRVSKEYAAKDRKPKFHIRCRPRKSDSERLPSLQILLWEIWSCVVCMALIIHMTVHNFLACVLVLAISVASLSCALFPEHKRFFFSLALQPQWA
jgi:hypothetical protein